MIDGKRFFTVVLRDISERKAMEEALQPSDMSMPGLNGLAATPVRGDTCRAAKSLFSPSIELRFTRHWHSAPAPVALC